MSDRLLLIADDGCEGVSALPDELGELLDGAEHVRVVAPTTGSRLETLTEDEEIYRAAIARAEHVAGLVRERGAAVDATHSENGPVESATAALRADDYDGVVLIATGEGHWREDGAIEDLRAATDLPVHVFTLG